MRVFLTGFMGAGKTTLGRLLAQRLGFSFVDLDASVEQHTQRRVSEIFADEGEEAFRHYEAECLRRTRASERVVVACGGGTPVDAGNRQWMRAHGRIVFLCAPLELILERLQVASERPLATGSAEIARLFALRAPVYEDCDLAIDVTREGTQALVDRLERALEAEAADSDLR